MIVAIKRAKRFSPNSEDKDARILECLCDLLKRSGFDVSVVDEDGFRLQNDVDAYISMARSEEALKELRKSNVPVINAHNGDAYRFPITTIVSSHALYTLYFTCSHTWSNMGTYYKCSRCNSTALSIGSTSWWMRWIICKNLTKGVILWDVCMQVLGCVSLYYLYH